MDIRIPYEPNKELGKAYNLAMESVNDWVLFMDHDILHLNPYYHDVCLAVIEKIGHEAGWVTCMTNRIACEAQWDREAPKNDDVMQHMKHAKKRWKEYGPELTEMNGDMTHKGRRFAGFSGFFMLTHKQAWKKVGGFKDGFLGVDNDYYEKLIKNGYKTYVMPGIYVYHIYRNKGKWTEL